MATINMTGFETGNVFCEGTPSGSANMQTSVVRSGTYALNYEVFSGDFKLYAQKANGELATDSTVPFATAFFRIYFRYATKPVTTAQPFARVVTTAAGVKLEVRLRSDGKLESGFGDVGATVLAADTWYLIEMKAETGTDVAWEVRLAPDDGTSSVTEMSGTYTSTGNCIHCSVGRYTVTDVASFFFDDILISNSGYPGPGRNAFMKPRANGTYFSQWTNGAGVGDYRDLAEIPAHDSDTTYYTTSTQNHVLSVLGDTSATQGVSGTINCVKSFIIGTDVTNTVNNQIGLRSNEADEYTTDFDYSAVYTTTRAKLFDTAASSAPWTTTLLDAAEPLHKKTQQQSRVLKCTWMGIFCDYTPAVFIAAKPFIVNQSVNRAGTY
jgi:hypothetical protein